MRNSRWSLGDPAGESSLARGRAFTRLDELAEELIELGPLDARASFPLGYQVTATSSAQTRKSKVQPTESPIASTKEVKRLPVLYLAPWVDLGGSDKGTLDWFKYIDRRRWAPSIITTQPSANRWLHLLEPHAEEIWSLPDLMIGSEFPSFILGFIETRRVKVVHIMNSRLGFDLIPDITSLTEPPAVVVQLHAEESDRSGYVRYVASRYGNLVDAFSVTSDQLAEAMLDYDVARSRIHMISTGVDGLNEFNPELVKPFDDLGADGLRILWPGRLVAQKDPLLSIEVIRQVYDRGIPATLHVVGEGDLKDEVARRADELGIGHLIRWHLASHEMPRWYRSCDLVLMTSTFEGVPYVIYEALAMGIPVVAPALPGNVELMSDGGGALIDPRDDVSAYADAIERFFHDPLHRSEVGAAARTRMLKDRSMPVMMRRHEEVFESLIDEHGVRELRAIQQPSGEEIIAADQKPVALPRSPPPARSVAVIVPCYQHGRFLPSAIQSLNEQTLQAARIVVVDDASADAETTEALDTLDHDPKVTVMRLARNSGPSTARNRALAEVRESYVLPLDADDMLPPRALETMVRQLERAPESIGFIYPNIQHFGNRHDYYIAPDFNLDVLLESNYCASAALFDRRVFDAGVRYSEEIVSGHEDWDLVLQLAERGVYGQPAEGTTLLYRKRGFSRVNAAEYEAESFRQSVADRHPLLYKTRRDAIKSQWAPALSILLIDGCDGRTDSWPSNLAQHLAEQTCRDFEIVCGGLKLDQVAELQICNVAGEAVELLPNATRAARGRFIALVGVSAAGALSRATFVEQIIRLFWRNPELSRFVLGGVEDRGGPRLAQLSAEQIATAIPAGVAWHRNPDAGTSTVCLGAARTPIEDILIHWQRDGPIEWRTL
jgi:glycosyltransferase involved in cell wall biosynthesis